MQADRPRILRPVSLAYKVSSPFGEERPDGPHKGIDFATPIGTLCVAVCEGVIGFVRRMDDPRFAKWNETTGNRIGLYAGGFCYLYAHLSRFNIEMGREVMAGQLICFTGDTGKVSGPHLHFGCKEIETNEPVEPIFVTDLEQS